VKGLAIGTVVKLVIVIIVIAVSLFFLSALADLELLFPSDLTTLKQYSTCALAYCSAGADSNEVRAVGCLKDKNGLCELSCLQVEEKIFDQDKYSFKDIYQRKHYCGKDNAIPFEFGLVGIGGTVDIRSGQMDTLAKRPTWICKSFEAFGYEVDDVLGDLPGVGLPGVSTADWAYNGNLLGLGQAPQNCLMLSKSRPDWSSYGNTLLFIGSFFVGGPETLAAGKMALAGVTTGAVSKAATGIVVPVSKKAIATTLTKIPGKGEVQSWAFQGALKGSGSVAGANLVAAADPFNFVHLKTNGGCFSGFVYDDLDDDRPSNKHLLYTPLVQYQKGKEWQKVYPSAIYVDESFTSPIQGQTKPECDFVNPSRAYAKTSGEDTTKIEEFKKSYVSDPANRAKFADIIIEEKAEEDGKPPVKRAITQDEIDQILMSEAAGAAVIKFGGDDPIIGLDMYGPMNQQFDYGNMLSNCKFRTRESNGKTITYKVWASPTFPGIGTLNALSQGGYDVADVEIEEGRVKKEDITNFVSDNSEQEIKRNSFDILESTFKTIFEKIEEGKKESIEAFSGFGSCAYVTLSRDIETPTIETETSEEAPEIVTRLELMSDKKEYSSGEQIPMKGTLEINGEPARGKEITIETKMIFETLPPFILKPQRTGTDENGNFKIEVEYETQTRDTYEVVARYGGSKSDPYRFTVS